MFTTRYQFINAIAAAIDKPVDRGRGGGIRPEGGGRLWCCTHTSTGGHHKRCCRRRRRPRLTDVHTHTHTHSSPRALCIQTQSSESNVGARGDQCDPNGTVVVGNSGPWTVTEVIFFFFCHVRFIVRTRMSRRCTLHIVIIIILY